MIIETIKRFLPSHRMTPSGWLSFNCPACQHFGHRADSKQRGGMILNNDSFTYNCFNCGFKTGWSSGSYLSKKSSEFFEFLNIPEDLILKMKLSVISSEKSTEDKEQSTSNRIYYLPKNARKINDLIDENYESDDFLTTLSYIGKRNINLINWYDLYYSPDEELNLKSSFIIPVKSNDQIVGWVSRTNHEQSRQKYILQTNKQFLFNSDVLFKKHRKYAIIVEGNLDAISIDGVATMGNTITDGQMKLLETSHQQKIIVPDKDKAGKELIEFALDKNWWVSLPQWDEKDLTDAVKKYGRVPSMVHLMENLHKTPLQIKIQSKKYFGELFV